MGKRFLQGCERDLHNVLHLEGKQAFISILLLSRLHESGEYWNKTLPRVLECLGNHLQNIQE